MQAQIFTNHYCVIRKKISVIRVKKLVQGFIFAG